MPQSPFVRISCKKTEEIDWISPLKAYIAQTYQDEPEKYSDELVTFNRLRQDMRGAGLDLTGRDLLYRYYGQLDLLELRFPVDENNIRISFTWFDVFNQKAISQFSLAYEKACVIFNIAAVLSALGASQTRSEPLGLKQAFHYLQLSAGVYSYINENFLHAPSSDLNREVVKILVQFMLAQAQECFLEKCLLEKKKGSLIFKLASQATYMYNGIVDSLSEGLPKTLFSQSFSLISQVKQKHYAALAHYHKALTLEEEAQYGEAVSRFTVAETLAKESFKLAGTLARALNSAKTTNFPPDTGSSLNDITKSNHELILEKRDSSIKDNELVYHDSVTKPEVLAPIEKLAAAKIIPFSEMYTPAELTKIIGPDVFHKLIPLSIHESASLYSEEKAKIIRQESERVDIANVELETSLSYMELPQCLSKFKENPALSLQDLTQPPHEILQAANQIYRIEANSQPLNALLASLRSANASHRNALEDAVTYLDEEFAASENLRAQHREAWKQTPSTTAANSLRQEIRSRRELLDKALQSDEGLVSRFNAYRDEFDILKANPERDQIGTALAEGMASASQNTTESTSLVDVKKEDSLPGIIESIEDCLSRLSLLKKERNDMLHDLKERTQMDDISHVLILNKKSPAIEPQIFSSELEKYRGHQNRITSTIHHQQAALAELSSHFKRLSSVSEAQKIHQNWETVNRFRNQLIQRLKAAAEEYHELRNGATAGQDFYLKVSPAIEEISVKVQRFCDSRKSERDQLEQTITQSQSDNQFIQLQAHLNKYSHPPQTDDLIQKMQDLSFRSDSAPSAPTSSYHLPAQQPFQASAMHANRYAPQFHPAPYVPSSHSMSSGYPNQHQAYARPPPVDLLSGDAYQRPEYSQMPQYAYTPAPTSRPPAFQYPTYSNYPNTGVQQAYQPAGAPRPSYQAGPPLPPNPYQSQNSDPRNAQNTYRGYY
ncbi:bck1-like resistance to osmotic shock [Entomophthora muscae]|uniref:Bck1-like resistance to osmotic shock n=1 Tax=Entomophthora muscae TaxID=34485 RepID=A0ACC2RJX3_9FUNG|nr:bck1-like resistance to osmotic shock [Entomophthora muscae]